MQQFFRSLKPKNIFDTANLDLEFGKTKSLVDTVSGKTLISFSRTTSATYFDAAGILRTSALNLLSYSEKFEQAPWSTFNVTVTADTVTAPNGILAADTITDVNTVTSSPIVFQAVTMADTTVYCMSCYIKAGTKTLARVGIRSKAGATISASFDLANGTTTLGNALTSSIEAVGNGWYRCSMTANSSTGATSTRAIVWINAGSYTPDGTGTIHVWGAQLEQSSVLSEYIPTAATASGAPRFDHDPVTGESLGLLIEGARTNVCLHSEGFDVWGINSGTTVAINATASPAGTTTAHKIVETAANVAHYRGLPNVLAANTTCTLSVYAKAGERNFIGLELTPDGTNYIYCTFNIQTGVASTPVNAGNGSGAIASIQAINNGWYRCVLTGIPSSTVANPLSAIYVGNANVNLVTNPYLGDGTSGLFVWGAQIEIGSTPSSYIPTTTASVTRAADTASISGSNFSSWYIQNFGSMYAEARTQDFFETTFPRIFSLDDGGATSSFIALVRGNGTSRWDYSVFSNGTGQVVGLNNGVAPSAGTICKGAVVYQADDFIGATQGVLMSADTSGSIPTVNALGIGMQSNGILHFNGTIRRLTYCGRRISNTELFRITK